MLVLVVVMAVLFLLSNLVASRGVSNGTNTCNIDMYTIYSVVRFTVCGVCMCFSGI